MAYRRVVLTRCAMIILGLLPITLALTFIKADPATCTLQECATTVCPSSSFHNCSYVTYSCSYENGDTRPWTFSRPHGCFSTDVSSVSGCIVGGKISSDNCTEITIVHYILLINGVICLIIGIIFIIHALYNKNESNGSNV